MLLLDEATTALDPATEAAVLAGVRHARPEAAVLMIAHRPTAVAQADRVVVLAGGRIVEEGTPGDLAVRDGHYRAFLLRGLPAATGPALAPGPAADLLPLMDRQDQLEGGRVGPAQPQPAALCLGERAGQGESDAGAGGTGGAPVDQQGGVHTHGAPVGHGGEDQRFGAVVQRVVQHDVEDVRERRR